MQGRSDRRQRGRGRSQRAQARSRRRLTLQIVAALAALAAGAALAAAPLLASTTGEAYAPLGSKLQSGESKGAPFFGRSVALSEDGTTAIVGAPHEGHEAGAAFVYVRAGSTWTKQQKLEAGEGSSFFGRAVALSADGDTALVGDPGNAEKVGAAWVFVRSGGGSTWALEARLTGEEEQGAAQFGRSVALSADGATALVGGFADEAGKGAAWAFARSGETWPADGAKITGAGEDGKGLFGRSVALSADGKTALVGASEDAKRAGAIFVLKREASGWVQQGAKLTGTDESGAGELGAAVALSGDGKTALAGAPTDEGSLGAASVFTESRSGWQQQGPKLVGSGESGPGHLGSSVALAADGATALLGGPLDGAEAGAAWVFERSGATWSQTGTKLTGSGEVGPGQFGFSVALSADASTALAGGIGDAAHLGAAWPFAREAPPEQPPTTQESTPTGTTTSSTPTSTPTTTVSHGVAGATFVGSPVLGVSGNIDPVSGKVLVELPGTHVFVLLSSLRQVPFGSVIDATEGHVQVTTAAPQGGQESGEFFDGQFVLMQSRNGVVTVQLSGGTTCPPPKHGKKHGKRHNTRKVADVAARRSGHRKLWSNAHGTFTSKGTYAAGAVQGTEWLTEDRCNGTFIKVTRDKVKVTDLVRHKTHIVRAGHSIFIKAP